jgi:hypothetical protein
MMAMLGSAFAGSIFRVHGSTFEVQRLLCGAAARLFFLGSAVDRENAFPRLLKKVQMQGGTP